MNMSSAVNGEWLSWLSYAAEKVLKQAFCIVVLPNLLHVPQTINYCSLMVTDSPFSTLAPARGRWQDDGCICNRVRFNQVVCVCG